LGAANFASIANTHAPDGRRGKVVFSPMHRNTQRPYPLTMLSQQARSTVCIGDNYTQRVKDAEFVYSGSF
jgi:hypothetical protein